MIFIKSVAVIDALTLSGMTRIPDVGVKMNYPRNFVELPVVPLVECVTERKRVDGHIACVTTVSMILSEPYALPDTPLAFLLTSVTGKRFLLGDFDPPRATVSSTVTRPSSPSASAAQVVEVSLTDIWGLTPILD